jgi:hypothetical protein
VTVRGGAGVMIGVRGGSWRGRVTPWGAVVPADGSASLDWSLAAADRWHVPAAEPSVRQRLIDGAPVVETAVRVPGGDALQRVFAVGDDGGLTVIEVENSSPSPFAVVLTRSDLLTTRRPSATALEGLDVPRDSLVLPVAHGSRVRVALAHDGRRGAGLPAGLPSAEQVARGWLAQTSRGIRLELPRCGPGVALTSLRAALLLEDPDATGDPAGFLVGVAERGRLGDAAAPWLAVVASAAEALVRRHRKAGRLPWEVDAALASARDVLARAGDRRAVDDLAAARRRVPVTEPTPVEPPEGVLGLAWAQRRVVMEQEDGLDVFPRPFPRGWIGQPIEAHGVPAGGTTIALALRWHGARPALLWEAGRGVRLVSSGLDPSWASTDKRGEALLSRARW